MFDFSGAELLVVIVVAVVLIGPKDLPRIMYNLGRFAQRLRYIRHIFSSQVQDFMKEHDLEDLHRGVNFEAPKQSDEETDEAGADEDLIASSHAEGKNDKS